MLAQRNVEENGSASMMAAKRSAGDAPEVNLTECVTHTPPPSANKAANSGFEPQIRRHQKSKTGVSVAPQKGFIFSIFSRTCLRLVVIVGQLPFVVVIEG